MGSVWECKLGEPPDSDIFDLPDGADSPMREAVRKAYIELTGKEPYVIFSGWGAEFSTEELEVIKEIETLIEEKL